MASAVSLASSLPYIILHFLLSSFIVLRLFANKALETDSWELYIESMPNVLCTYHPCLLGTFFFKCWRTKTNWAFVKSRSRACMFVTFCLECEVTMMCDGRSSLFEFSCSSLLRVSSWRSSCVLITGVWSLQWLLAWPSKTSLWVSDPYSTACFHLPQ